MSSDGNGPDTPRQRPGNASWGQSFEHTHQVEHDVLPPLPDSRDEEVFDSDPPDAPQEMSPMDEDEDLEFEPASTLLEQLKQLGQYVPLIIAPLLFGALTCLFVLPLIATNKAYIAPAGLVPMIILIIVVAVAQGIGVYYAGSNNGIWVLATAGGFFLFLLIGTLAIFGPVPAIIILIALVALSILLARLYFHPVAEGYVELVYSFGKYSRTLYPGPNMLLPWEKATHPLNVGEKQWVCSLQKVQLSRDEDVVLRATISYQLLPEDAYIAFTQVNQWEENLKELVVSTIQSIATTFSPDDFIAWPQGLNSRPLTYDNIEDGELRWERVNTYLYELIRDRVALWGVQVNWVRIRDVSLAPHGATIVEMDTIFDTPTTVIEPSAAAAGPAPKSRAAQAPAARVPSGRPKVAKNSTNNENANPAEETTQAMPAPPPQSIPNPPAPPQLPNEKVLIEAYKAVQEGKITDPDTIRSIAAKFELVGQDTNARNTVSFDAERAAQILYDRAQKYDAMYGTEPPYEDETSSDWAVRRPGDGNLMAGG